MGETSRELFLQQLERCVKHQNPEIPAESPILAPSEPYAMGEFIAPEPMGNGAGEADVDTTSIWGLRPPGEDQPQYSDWA